MVADARAYPHRDCKVGPAAAVSEHAYKVRLCVGIASHFVESSLPTQRNHGCYMKVRNDNLEFLMYGSIL